MKNVELVDYVLESLSYHFKIILHNSKIETCYVLIKGDLYVANIVPKQLKTALEVMFVLDDYPRFL